MLLKGTLRRGLMGAIHDDTWARPRSRAKDMTMREEMVRTDWVQNAMARVLMNMRSVAPTGLLVDWL